MAVALLATVSFVFGSGVPAGAVTATPASHATVTYCQQATITASCLHAAVADFNIARHKEGLGPIVLPTNFVHLSVPKQLFVLINIERIDRHLPPFNGLSSALNAAAQTGANKYATPQPPSHMPAGTPHASAWSRASNALYAEFVWMYGGSATVRNGLLMNVCGPLTAGAALASGHAGAGVFLEGLDTRDRADVFTWNGERAYFPAASRERATASLPWVVRTSAPSFYRDNYWTLGISSPGTFSPAAAVRAQWYVDGVAQPGATSHQYTLTRAQHGHTVSVKLTAGRSGYMSCGKAYDFGRIS
ncbi:hypothetical protein Back2_06980 [Nocardioides baekrokdamisoli]|uniref:SCP domain-containing protein n=1 Tax=Nocardioides baekrokdamisoli TaxID=1804624 RepID=A0A3G9IS17_9ACTN|nr:hypothetical protein Back2_06980 [Nocardioides baekrokdamisoli]